MAQTIECVNQKVFYHKIFANAQHNPRQGSIRRTRTDNNKFSPHRTKKKRESFLEYRKLLEDVSEFIQIVDVRGEKRNEKNQLKKILSGC